MIRGRLDRLAITCSFLQERFPYPLDAALILGSGWGDFVSCLEEPVVVPYT